MSYTPLPDQPPSYPPDQQQEERRFDDNIPDDFKYSVNVASCDLSIRQLFIRKVYSLLTLQIMLTTIVGFIIHSSDSIKSWVLSNPWTLIIGFIGSIGFMIGSFWKSRNYPINLILLSGFTICEAFTLGFACAFIENGVLLKAILLTLIIFIGLTVFAFQTKYDFISWQGSVGMLLWGLIGFGFIMWFLPYNSMIENIYSFLGAIIFAIFILIDTQNIMKTCHLDDEVIATIQLYLDIVNLFLFILRLLNNNNNDN